MTKETLKEIEKLSFDIAKIVFAIAILTPLLKDAGVNYSGIAGAIALILGGTILINKGTKEDEGIWNYKFNYRCYCPCFRFVGQAYKNTSSLNKNSLHLST